jgi:hypothetical protein
VGIYKEKERKTRGGEILLNLESYALSKEITCVIYKIRTMGDGHVS